MAALSEFVGAAREFLDWCDSPLPSESEEARKALELLLRLYSLAWRLRLPDSEDIQVGGSRTDEATWTRVFERAGKLPFNYYAEVFDPLVVPGEEPSAGDLADDIADIHRDLTQGLSLFDAGHNEVAEWQFTFSFRSHWGRHASSAIRALHCWFAETGRW